MAAVESDSARVDLSGAHAGAAGDVPRDRPFAASGSESRSDLTVEIGRRRPSRIDTGSLHDHGDFAAAAALAGPESSGDFRQGSPQCFLVDLRQLASDAGGPRSKRGGGVFE